MMEEWKEVEIIRDRLGKEGYMISTYGRFKNSNGITIGYKNNRGYRQINIKKNGRTFNYYIHKLVALAFIENDDPETKNQINHKDGDKDNNCVDNLEWCTSSHNIKHSFDTGLKVCPNRRRVIGFYIDNNDSIVKQEYVSAKIAESKTKAARRNISAVCCGKKKTAGGLVWIHKDTVDTMTEKEIEDKVRSAYVKVNAMSKSVVVPKEEGDVAYTSISEACREEGISRYGIRGKVKSVGKSITTILPCKKRPVHQYSLDGEFIKAYTSTTDAVKALFGEQISQDVIERKITNISRCCRRKRNKTENYIWRWENDCSDMNRFKCKKKKVYCFDMVTKVLVLTYNSIREASEGLDKSESVISNICNDQNKTRECGGYYISYEKEYKETTCKRKVDSVKRRVVRYDLNGKKIDIFTNCSEAAKKLGKNTRNITEVCRGDVYSTLVDYIPYVFRYEDEPFESITREDVRNKRKKEKQPVNRILNKDKQIIQYDMEGNIVETFDSTEDAIERLGMSQESIRQLCTGRRIATLNGYVLRYEGDAFDKYSVVRSKGGSRRKKVYCFNPKTKECVAEYEGLKEAAKSMGVDSTTIGKRCKEGALWRGYRWSYDESI